MELDESCVYKVILKNKAQLRSSSHDQGWVEFLMTQFINPISSLKEEARAQTCLVLGSFWFQDTRTCEHALF